MISSDKIKRRRLSAKERNEFYKMYGGRCAYCGAKITFRGMQIDHKIPLAINGEDTKENMLPACRTCRRIKGTSDIESFRKTISILIMRYAGISEQVQFYFEKVREHEKI